MSDPSTEVDLGPTADREDERPTAVLWALVMGAVVAGSVFRFVTRSALWLDEALSVNIASLPPGDIFEALRHDGHPPLYYLLLHGWMQVAGTGDVAVRSLSGIFGLLTLPLAWIAGVRRGGRVLGAVFVAVLAVSPFALRYGSEARMYSLVSFLALAGYLLVDDVVRGRRSGPLRLAAIAGVSGLLLLSHYWSMWLLGAAGLVCLWQWRRADEPEVRAGALRAALAMAAGGLLFAWWLPTMLYQSAHTGTPWSQPVRPTVTASMVLTDFAAGTSFPDAPALTAIYALLFAVGLFAVRAHGTEVVLDLRTNRQVRFEAMVVALTLAIGIVIGFATRSAFASRYASVLYPIFLLVVAAGVTRFADRRVRNGVLAVVLLASGLGAVYNAFVFQRTQVRELTDEIRTQGRPGDVVVFCPDQLGPSGSRALGPGFTTLAFPTLDDPARVDWVDYPARNAAADPEAIGNRILERAGADHSIFVVWSGTYRTFEHKCEEMIATISRARPVSRTLDDAQPEKYFESATLSWFEPVGGARP